MSINDSGVDYKHDAENRLVKVSQGAQYVARLAYDGDGKRAKRVDSYGSIHYVGPHYERNVGTGADTTEVVTKFYYAQLGPYRRLIALRRNGVLYYVHSDHLGGSNILSDTSGSEVGALRYHSYGQTRVQSGTVPTDKKFTGQTLDASSGLYHYGARYYDAALGRFVQPDSMVPQPGDPQALNRYSYVLNNPLRWTDPTGSRPIYGDEDDGGLNSNPPSTPAPVPAPTAIPGQPETGPDPELAREDTTGVGIGPEAYYGYAVAEPHIDNPFNPGPATTPVWSPWNIVNNAIGVALEVSSTGEKRVEQGDVVVVENAGGLAGLVMDALGTPAFTVGNYIFAKRHLETSQLLHERAHVTQSGLLGPLYLPTYATSHALLQFGAWMSRDPYNVHAANPMEMWADRMAGRPPEALFR